MLGKLSASVLSVVLMLVSAVPFFMMIALFGGVSFAQIRGCLSSSAAVLAGGSLGSMIALAREKSFLSLALTTLVLFFWLALWTIVSTGVLGTQWQGVSAGHWAAMFSPVNAVSEAARPVLPGTEPFPVVGSAAYAFSIVAVVIAVLLNAWAILRVRVWNPSRKKR